MNKQILYYFILLFMFFSCTQKKSQYILGEKFAAYEVIRGTNIKHGSYVQFGFENKDTVGVANFLFNMEHGEDRSYSEGILSSKANYKWGKLDGLLTDYYDKTSKVKYVIEYKKDKIWNIISYLDINGNSLDNPNFKNGNGYVYVYDSLGVIIEEGEIKNGYKQGYWKRISNTGYVDSTFYNKGFVEYDDWEGLEALKNHRFVLL